jgi:hypothetical protein
MKTIRNILLPLIAVAAVSCGDDDSETLNIPEISQEACMAKHFYYYNDAPVTLGDQLAYGKALIGFYDSVDNSHITALINSEDGLKNISDEMIGGNDGYKFVTVEFGAPKTCPEIHHFIEEMKAKTAVAFASYVYDDTMTYSDEFLIKVHDASDLTSLEATAAQTNTTIKGAAGLDNWFLLSANEDSAGDALDMANHFYETGLFEHAEPNFLGGFHLN